MACLPSRKTKILDQKVSEIVVHATFTPNNVSSRAGAEVRTLASHQCGPGSILGLDTYMWVEFVGSLLCSKGFFFFGGGGVFLTLTLTLS